MLQNHTAEQGDGGIQGWEKIRKGKQKIREDGDGQITVPKQKQVSFVPPSAAGYEVYPCDMHY